MRQQANAGKSILITVGLAFLVAIEGAIGSGTNAASVVAVVALVPTAIVLYFLPSIVASRSGHPNTTAIVILNFFLGWTVLGWVCAFVWAHLQGSTPQAASTPEAAPLAATAPAEVARAPHPARSVADELDKLAHLLDRGLLTPDEFAAQKAELLRR